MDISQSLLGYLRHLSADPDQAAQLTDRLAHLSDDIAVWVPSWLSVSILLNAQTQDISVSVLAPGIDADVAVLSSLALEISQPDGGTQLILRAGQTGAFLLLGDDFTARLGPTHPVTLDRHLTLPPTLQEQAAALDDLGAINQAIGVLLVEGFTPTEAHRELQHRADAAGGSLPATAFRLLRRSQKTPPDPDPVDTG